MFAMSHHAYPLQYIHAAIDHFEVDHACDRLVLLSIC